MADPSHLPTPVTYVAVLGDIVSSRRLDPSQRRDVQRSFQDLLQRLNHSFASALAARFALTAGDEFEVLLFRHAAPAVLPDLLWQAESALPGLLLRFGIGLGAIDTDLAPDANSVDGPAFHAAREAIQNAARLRQLGGVFRGFGPLHDPVLNGIARLLHHQRSRWSRQQRRLAVCLRQGLTQAQAAVTLGLTPQAVSSYARAAGWNAYAEGERALRAALDAATSDAPRYHSPDGRP